MMSPVISGLYLYALISQFVELKDMFSVGEGVHKNAIHDVSSGKKDFPSKKQLNQTSVAQMVPRASIVT